jgi:hypothetical protein
VKAVFVELPAFERYRAEYFSDEAFTILQAILMKSPEAGDVIEGTGGLRKLRFADARRGKGKRGGLRVIYYWWEAGCSSGSTRSMTRMSEMTCRPSSENY